MGEANKEIWGKKEKNKQALQDVENYIISNRSYLRKNI